MNRLKNGTSRNMPAGIREFTLNPPEGYYGQGIKKGSASRGEALPCMGKAEALFRAG